MHTENLRVLITGDNASTRFGGESILPYHYFRLLNERGIDTWLVTHARCKKELHERLPHLVGKMTFIQDNSAELFLYKIETIHFLHGIRWIPGWMRHTIFQWKQRKAIKKLVKENQINIVHQVTPVSPKQPSMIYNVGAKVVIGPLNGGMNYPASFKNLKSFGERAVEYIGRKASHFLNFIIPGKQKADLLLVANERTKNALPAGIKVPIVQMVENGIDLRVWTPHEVSVPSQKNPVKFVYLGRLVRVKGLEYLIKAFQTVSSTTNAELHIIGDGPLRKHLGELASFCGDKVVFHGFVEWEKCPELMKQFHVMVMPSLHECGGASVLEGMVSGLPVVATAWGGPLDYLDEKTGIFVQPIDEPLFVEGLYDAMDKLTRQPNLRYSMGKAGQEKAIEQFDWERKIDKILSLYSDIV